MLIPSTIVAGGALLALGMPTMIAGGIGALATDANCKERGDEGDRCMERTLIAAMGLLGLAMVILPTENGIEFLDIDLDNLPPGITLEDAEIFNSWSAPLSLRSRSVSAAASRIQHASDVNLYDTTEEVANLVRTIWEQEFTKIGLSEEDKIAIKNVMSAHIN